MTPPVVITNGLLAPRDNEILFDRIFAVQVRLPSWQTPSLKLDGQEISSDRIGFKKTEHETDTILYSYIGIDIGDKGTHTLHLTSMDPLGNVRVNQKAKLTRAGEIRSIRFVEAQDAVADGKTPVRMRFELKDELNNVIKGSTRLTLMGGNLRPYKKEDESLSFDDKVARNWVVIDSEGWINFQPVTITGQHTAKVGANKVWAQGETYVNPEMRDWILVGMAQGTVGYNTVSGNMEALASSDAVEGLYHDEGLAFYAKGQIKGKWLATVAYDSKKNKDPALNSLFQVIDPENYFTLYGDASSQSHDAPSMQKLYLKIERRQFYALFGDYEAGLTTTELSRYSRRLTGVKSEFQHKYVDLNVFGSQTDRNFIRDEVPADGTSGLYRLSHRNITLNSEKIVIETRDRLRTEVVVATRTMTRFIDYTFDYESGTVFFKEPIWSRDPNFNPVTIVVEYESLAQTMDHMTLGGRVGTKLFDQRLKTGFSYVREDQGDRVNSLYGLDSRYQIIPGTEARAELAMTTSNDGITSTSGTAFLTEVLHSSKKWDANAYVRQQLPGFGLGQQNSTESATRKFGGGVTYRINEQFNVASLASRQMYLISEARRDVAEARLNYLQKTFGATGGVLVASDKLADGTSYDTAQAILGGKYITLKERLTLSAEHAQSLYNSGNVDFPTRTLLGAEYKLTQNVAVFGAEELTFGSAVGAHSRVGLRSSPWKGATLMSSLEDQRYENNNRLFSNLGLRQQLQVSESWRVDAGLERSQTWARSGTTTYQITNTGQSLFRSSEDFTAVSLGGNYQRGKWLWDNRLELRLGETENKYGVMSGVVTELRNGWATSGRAQFYAGFSHNLQASRTANLRWGLVYRPGNARWIFLNRMDFIVEKQTGTITPTDSRRVVNVLAANYKPRHNLQLSVSAGVKLARETVVEQTFEAVTDELGFEGRYDINDKWDIGVRASLLHAWQGGQLQFSAGPSVGYNVATNTWISVGFNAWGYSDRDFAASNYAAAGPYIKLRFKFDQQSVTDAAKWINNL